MHGKKLIEKLYLKNFLSYGSEGDEITLEPLNVLIGPNASGKSNLIEALNLLYSTPTDLAGAIRRGGGVREWLWKGTKADPIAEIEAIVDFPGGPLPLRYQLSFTSVGQRLEIVDEIIENKKPANDLSNNANSSFYHYKDGTLLAHVSTGQAAPGAPVGRIVRRLSRDELDTEQSILSQRKDTDTYPEITYLGNQFANIHVFTEWNLGRDAELRKPQKTDDPDDFLLKDARNLGLVLNDLHHRSQGKLLIKHLKKFYDAADEINTKVQGGTIQIFINENSLQQSIPAVRLSDGTLRYLCLLTILCHPSPPPLICLEEPELGLHPDILPTIADLLIEASQRTQLVVTTHSDTLVSALTEIPEAVLVCERDDTGSHLCRLEAESLKEWLKNYSLGELWRMGEIGGTRW
jgi:predicted ATPase